MTGRLGHFPLCHYIIDETALGIALRAVGADQAVPMSRYDIVPTFPRH